ncbi:MAG: Gfo/Idh/MocA family oxidoreductase [Gammaproteobacteria bacterium]
MTLNSINIGIVGPGRVAKRFANAIHLVEGLKLWSICSRQLVNAQEFANQYQYDAPEKIAVYDDFKKMLQDPNLHAIIITTPDKFHYRYACEALEHGKHILIEKPVCTEISEGKRLEDIASKTKCVVAIGYHLRWHPGLRLLAKKINTDGFGKIHHININWAHTFIEEASWRTSHETSKWWSKSTLTTHCLDIVRWLMLSKCGEVKNITGMTTNTNFGGNDENAILSLEFEYGATANIFTSILFHTPFQIEVFGEKNHAKGLNLVSSTDKGELYINNLPSEYSSPSNLYACELENFIDAIHKKRTVEVSLKEGLRNVELLIQSESTS